jgi:hypothetical protein
LSKDCPTRKRASIQQATAETVKTSKKVKEEYNQKDEPPSYNSLLKQINTCSMEDRQKILEVFSQDRSEPKDF